MNETIAALTGTAAALGFIHTLSGPDHYIPFIVMAKARKWTWVKTTWITVLCGLGHVGSSIILGAVGIAFGIGVARLEFFEGYRGSAAAWLFILFGLAYFIWGLVKGIRNRKHEHFHVHGNKIIHAHEHEHHSEKGNICNSGDEHKHASEKIPVHAHKHKANLTPWILFTIFVFGPCEPLIPLLMYPAAKESTWGTVMVAGVFSVVTIATMLVMVLLPLKGLRLFSTKWLERWMHTIAGATILICGLGIEFFGL